MVIELDAKNFSPSRINQKDPYSLSLTINNSPLEVAPSFFLKVSDVTVVKHSSQPLEILNLPTED